MVNGMTTNTTLLLGGTGKTGRRIAQRLEARGVPVRVGSRTGTPRFDWDEPATWTAVLDGVDAVYIAYYPDLAVPEAAAHIDALAKRAVAAGVRRIVLLSGRGEDGVLPAEAAVRTSGADFTILRAAFMAQNFSEGYLVDGVRGGEVAFPADEVREPFIDVDDIADVAALALTTDDHRGATYELTGPRLLTFGEATSEIASTVGREIAYTPLSSEAYAQTLAAFLPPPSVAFLIELFANVLDGHNAHVSDDVARVLGRPARDFRAYARDAAAAGCWTP